jgi:methylated-DNA-[protein]-cysteine S-methyltransferase
MTDGFALFDTPIGCCGIAWKADGIAGVQLPEADESRTRRRLQERFPTAVESSPAPDVQRVVDDIRRLLAGNSVTFEDVQLDLRGIPEFNRRVYAIARAIPLGETLSYGEIAQRLGDPGCAQAVGQALGRNPFPLIIPCHRVLGAGGKAGGFSATGGVRTKLKLLTIERARIGSSPGLFDRKP